MSIVNEISEKLNYSVLSVTKEENNGVIRFIECVNESSAIITDSFHATVFSILFNKPFVTFLQRDAGIERILSLNNTFNIGNRLYRYSEKEKIKSNETLSILNPLNVY